MPLIGAGLVLSFTPYRLTTLCLPPDQGHFVFYLFVMNYRKFYAEKTGFNMPDGFDIHHIDHDRDNNELSNLVALPSHTHRHYHQTENKIEAIEAIYGITRGMINSIEINFSCSFQEYQSGVYKQTFNGSEDEYLENCIKARNEAGFLCEVFPVLVELENIKADIRTYQKLQQPTQC